MATVDFKLCNQYSIILYISYNYYVERALNLMMSTVQEFDFVSGDAEASMTQLVKASSLRKGGYVMLRGYPCKIMEMSAAQPGKHGHSKIHFIGLDVFTGKKHEDICPSKETIEVS